VTKVAEHSMRIVCHVAQVVCVVMARGTSLAIFTICWRTVELDLGGLCQPFSVSELLLSCQLSLEEVNPHLVLAPILVQALDLLLEKQVFLLCRRSVVLARWLPGLKKVPAPSVRGAGLLRAPKRRRASTLLTMHSKSAPPLGGAEDTAQSLHSRAMSADWPQMF
jgi:hypothetical protein